MTDCYLYISLLCKDPINIRLCYISVVFYVLCTYPVFDTDNKTNFICNYIIFRDTDSNVIQYTEQQITPYFVGLNVDDKRESQE